MNGAEFLYGGAVKAFELIINLDPYVMSITGVSIKVSGTATILAALTAIPLAFALSFLNFRGKQGLITLVTPIIAGISLAAIKAVPGPIIETVYTLGGREKDAVITTLKEAKFGIITAILAGLGRALAEVGAILIVGGNIAETGSIAGIGEGLSRTRTLTTAIVSETSKWDISTALALGIILISLNLSVNLLANFFLW